MSAAEPGGIDVQAGDLAAFTPRLARENPTHMRALTDPHHFGAFCNAYSNEILHRARTSPLALTRSLADAQRRQLLESTRVLLGERTERLRAEAPDWPEEVTAFRPGLAVHGRFGHPLPGMRGTGAAHRRCRQ